MMDVKEVLDPLIFKCPDCKKWTSWKKVEFASVDAARSDTPFDKLHSMLYCTKCGLVQFKVRVEEQVK